VGVSGDVAELDDVLRGVGPRLRALRQQRGVTLAELAQTTGISVSTLSRLESGQRRPTLELLLPLAQAHQVPLDELAGVPPTGDPRIHARPVKRGGATFVPLTRRPGGLRAYKQIHRFDGRAGFGTWLYRICSNCCLDLLRSKKNKGEMQPAASEDGQSWLDRVAAPGFTPERLAESSQIAGILEPALKKLTDMERTAFILRHYEGCDIDQIACILGVHANAAKHSVFRAVQKLRRELQPAWGAAQ